MTKKELQVYKEARQICAWLGYRDIKIPAELLEIAVNKKFRGITLGDYPKLKLK